MAGAVEDVGRWLAVAGFSLFAVSGFLWMAGLAFRLLSKRCDLPWGICLVCAGGALSGSLIWLGVAAKVASVVMSSGA